jgi:Ca-activated chloride channel homolog
MGKCGWKESGTVTLRWWGRVPLSNGRDSDRSRARKRAVCMAALMATAALFAQEPTIRVNVNLVHVIATVKNRSGQLVGSLKKEDFQIFDNGVPQEVAVFARQTDQPLSVALLVDTSGSTAKDLKYETDSAARFLRALLAEGNPEDRAALYTFNYDIEGGKYTHDYGALERRLKTLHGEAGTSLYDAIYYASRDLESRDGRKALVVVTDGGDTTSLRDLKQALKQAQMADAVLYAVVVLPITNDAGRNTGGEHALEFMAEGTGGRTFYPAVNAELDATFSDIISELRTQYLIGFYPHQVPPGKDPFHRLDVRVKFPDLRVSARSGYYGDSTGSGDPDAQISVKPERTAKRH